LSDPSGLPHRRPQAGWVRCPDHRRRELHRVWALRLQLQGIQAGGPGIPSGRR